MASKITWSNPSAWSELVGGTSGATTASLANGVAVVGIEYDNSARNQLADFGVYVRTTTAPSTAGIIDLYILTEVSTGVYEDGSSSVIPSKPPFATVIIKSATTAQILSVIGQFIPPGKFKILFVNRSGTALTASNTENKLTIRAYSPEGQ